MSEHAVNDIKNDIPKITVMAATMEATLNSQALSLKISETLEEHNEISIWAVPVAIFI